MVKRHSRLKPKKELPHISRSFSARFFPPLVKTTLWLGIAGLIAVNVSTVFQGKPLASDPFPSVLLNPTSAQGHIELAHTYFQNHLEKDAKRELAYADELFGRNPPEVSQNILGATSKPSDLLTLWQEEPKEVNREYEFWRGVIKEKPDYRDAYLVLAALAFKQSSFDEARSYLSQANHLDPSIQTSTLWSELGMKN